MILFIFSTVLAFAQHERNGREYRDQVDANLTKLESQVQACFDKETTNAARVPCARRGAQIAEEYLQKEFKFYVPALLLSEQRAQAASSALKTGQVEWTKHRVKMCAFVVAFNDPDSSKPELREFWKNFCILKTSVQRLRDVYKLGWAMTMW